MENSYAKCSEGVDRLSELPDEIVFRLLYFTGMRQAVQTSLLSKRWKYMWRRMPHLNFDASEFFHTTTEPNDCLFDFARRVVRLHDESCPVQEVRFATLNDHKLDNTFATFWKKMRRLLCKLKPASSLEGFEFCCYKVPLRKPQIGRFVLDPWVPHRHDFELNRRNCSVEYLNCIDLWSEELVFSEENVHIDNISIVNCNFLGIQISQRRLKTLKLVRCAVEAGPIRVSAANLVSIDLRQISSSSLCIENSPSPFLKDAVFDFILYDNEGEVNGAIELMHYIKHVRTLTLHFSILRILLMDQYICGRLPAFPNLQHMEILFVTTDQPFGTTKDLFKQSPYLETLMPKLESLEISP